jgi:hypothetical protein
MMAGDRRRPGGRAGVRRQAPERRKICRFVPLHTGDALILRTYALGEADRIVVFLTRDRGKKRGVAKNARRSRRRFGGALEPLTETRVAYYESPRRELVGLNYAEAVRSPLGVAGGGLGSDAAAGALDHVGYFAELLDECAQDADADDRLYRLGASVLDGFAAGAPIEPLARYFEYWLLRLQGVYPERIEALSPGARAFVQGARSVAPQAVATLPADRVTLRELEHLHRGLIAMHLEKTLKSDRVLRDLRRHA